MLFRPAAILLAAGICATRATTVDIYDVDLFSGPDVNGTKETHHVEIGHKYWWDDLACGSCKDITKIPAGELNSWVMVATCHANLRFYGKKGCEDELRLPGVIGGRVDEHTHLNTGGEEYVSTTERGRSGVKIVITS
ncbi:hypothetical protein BV22DRAFT_1188617 [Leucogyrophana mollusca]|uniref:Uncharacterized protein n=1 Tax=Leucogyrophana mollusca TaxID=85980 RepID=A0ACB8AWV3_9AGAM|nr:hypothetical protein BV22DRAFT_1188617 [Leucogyrophana mollusca]